jgi:hypothetical protein
MIQILIFLKEQVFNSICVIQNNDEKTVFTKDILKIKTLDLDCVFSHISISKKEDSVDNYIELFKK